MSKKHLANITCPDCHKESPFVFWDSVNTALEPKLKEQLLNFELFKFTCQHCHSEQFVNHGLLYHDPEAATMIYYVQSEDEARKVRELFKEDMKEDEAGRYKKRLVMGVDNLIEKIHIFDQGWDDRLVEIFKIFLYGEVREQLAQVSEGKDVDYIFLDKHLDGGFYFVFVSEGSPLGEVPFDQTAYDELSKRYQEALADSGEAVEIDSDWAFDFLKAHTPA